MILILWFGMDFGGRIFRLFLFPNERDVKEEEMIHAGLTHAS